MRITRKGVSSAFWREQRDTFCFEGRIWAKKFKTAGAAWHACQNGCFLAWWLSGILRKAERSELVRLNGTRHVPHAYIEEEFTQDELKTYADNIRRVFRVDGTRK